MSTYTKEYFWVVVVTILILAFGTLPIIAGYASQTPDQRFIGTFFDKQDYAVHMAMIHYGEEGGWGYQLRFTTEPHTIAYVRIFYVVLGHFWRWTHIPPAILYQTARLIFGLLAGLSIYRLLSRVFISVAQRRLAFVLAILGSGIGWFQILFGFIPTKISPIDLWFIDAYPLFSINMFPHFSAVFAALAIAITAYLDHILRPRWQNVVVIAACALFVQVIHPTAFILADLAMVGIFAFTWWQKRRLDVRQALSLILVAAIQIPVLVYTLVLFLRDPAWALVVSQDVTLSPPPIYYLFGFGLFWPFAIAGAIKALREREPVLGWALVWTVSAFGLAFLPVNSQRRFLLAITLPLAVLATPPLLDFSHWLGMRLRFPRNTGAMLITALASISTVLLITNYTIVMTRRPPTLFEQTALVQAVDWLAINGSPDDVVLASEPTSQLVAIRTPLRLYFGHEMETLHYNEKSQVVERFYRGGEPPGWLKAQGITWVILSPHEIAWLGNPLESSGLEIAYQNSNVIVYRIAHP
jgi:hypothetical protein